MSKLVNIRRFNDYAKRQEFVERMTPQELKYTSALALVFVMRLLGLFMILPVLPLYANQLPEATPFLIGLAAGIYGFTQALFQLPYGMLSDRWGRKPLILIGLITFLIGSLLASFSSGIWGIICGRALQGAGAIGSPIMALAGDITREEVRTRAMAIIGISIGLAFMTAFLLGPLLDSYIGLQGLFVLTAILAAFALWIVKFLPSLPPMLPAIATGKQVMHLIKQNNLLGLNINIFVLHALFTASFLVLPLKIKETTLLSGHEVWKFYLPTLIISLLLALPLLRRADQAEWQTRLMQVAMIAVGISIAGFSLASHTIALILAVILFFTAFNLLEASLPACLSKLVTAANKGTAMGIYACFQFLGIFCGGAVGGWLQQIAGENTIAFTGIALAGLGAFTLSRLSLSKFKNNANLNLI